MQQRVVYSFAVKIRTLALMIALPVAAISAALAAAHISSDSSFGELSFHVIDISLETEALKALRKSPRSDVLAEIHVDKTSRVGCYLRLKGNSSFQAIDEKPSFTIKPIAGRLLGGFRKLHLNNCLQDPTLMRDYVGRVIFRRLAVPVPRAGHAVVRLNGRYLGAYSWVQGIDREFLEQGFEGSDGSLIQGSEEDITSLSAGIIRKRGESRSKRQHVDPLDDARFGLVASNASSFLIGELLTAHEDGGAFNNNNYWIYWPAGRPDGYIFPHTMDAAYRSRTMLGPTVTCGALVNYLQQPENRNSVLEGIMAVVADRFYWSEFFTAFDIYSSNLLERLAPFEGDAIVKRCRDISQLRVAMECNNRLIEKACRRSISNSEEFDGKLNWNGAIGVDCDVKDSNALDCRVRAGMSFELGAHTILPPGRYRLTIDRKALFGDAGTGEVEKTYVWNAGALYSTTRVDPRFTVHDFTVHDVKVPVVRDTREVIVRLFLRSTRSGTATIDARALTVNKW